MFQDWARLLDQRIRPMDAVGPGGGMAGGAAEIGGGINGGGLNSSPDPTGGSSDLPGGLMGGWFDPNTFNDPTTTGSGSGGMLNSIKGFLNRPEVQMIRGTLGGISGPMMGAGMVAKGWGTAFKDFIQKGQQYGWDMRDWPHEPYSGPPGIGTMRSTGGGALGSNDYWNYLLALRQAEGNNNQASSSIDGGTGGNNTFGGMVINQQDRTNDIPWDGPLGGNQLPQANLNPTFTPGFGFGSFVNPMLSWDPKDWPWLNKENA